MLNYHGSGLNPSFCRARLQVFPVDWNLTHLIWRYLWKILILMTCMFATTFMNTRSRRAFIGLAFLGYRCISCGP